MSGTSSADDSELEPEVPTEVPSDVEVVAASGDGVPGPPGPAVTSPSPAMASAPAVEFFPDTFLTLLRPSRRPSLGSNAWCSIRPTVISSTKGSGC